MAIFGRTEKQTINDKKFMATLFAVDLCVFSQTNASKNGKKVKSSNMSPLQTPLNKKIDTFVRPGLNLYFRHLWWQILWQNSQWIHHMVQHFALIFIEYSGTFVSMWTNSSNDKKGSSFDDMCLELGQPDQAGRPKFSSDKVQAVGNRWRSRALAQQLLGFYLSTSRKSISICVQLLTCIRKIWTIFLFI